MNGAAERVLFIRVVGDGALKAGLECFSDIEESFWSKVVEELLFIVRICTLHEGRGF
jgi:hypothetical protein